MHETYNKHFRIREETKETAGDQSWKENYFILMTDLKKWQRMQQKSQNIENKKQRLKNMKNDHSKYYRS